MKIITFLFFTIFIIPNIEGETSFSIQSIINKLQEDGYYEIIQLIKYKYGNDVAIAFCKALIESNDCETIVKIYMPDNPVIYPINPINPNKEIEEIKNKIPENIHERVEPLITCTLKYYDILLKNMKEESKVISFIRKINSNIKIIKEMPPLQEAKK